jgi:hypothetical protein
VKAITPKVRLFFFKGGEKVAVGVMKRAGSFILLLSLVYSN